MGAKPPLQGDDPGLIPPPLARGQAGRVRIRLVRWRPVRQGKLFGFAAIELPIGLQINECPVVNGPEGIWASLPAKPELDREGRRRLGSDGKPVYQDVLIWRSRRLRQAFSDRVVALVRDSYPQDLVE